MTVPTTTMIDTTHANVDKIPTSVAYIGGYVSGTPDIQWNAADWVRFSGRKVRNYQGLGPVPPLNMFDELDVENRALTPVSAAAIVKARVEAGFQWTTIYGGDAAIAATASEIQKLGHSIWNGHVNCRLANWNLNEAEATKLVGTYVHGMSCIGVQWASPSSNPHTILPGSTLTLSQANADLSVVDAGWIPSGGFTNPNPPPPIVVSTQGIVVYGRPDGTLLNKNVSSTDGGVTWR